MSHTRCQDKNEMLPEEIKQWIYVDIRGFKKLLSFQENVCISLYTQGSQEKEKV